MAGTGKDAQCFGKGFLRTLLAVKERPASR